MHWHSFTGCDTSSSFFGKGKTTLFDAWLSFPQITKSTETFIELSDIPKIVTKDHQNILEDFFMFVYFGKNHQYDDINNSRCISFFNSPDPKLKEIIMSKDALLQHIKRAAYQAGWLWKESTTNVILPDPILWGWEVNTNSSGKKYIPRWESNKCIVDINSIISACSCKRGAMANASG